MLHLTPTTSRLSNRHFDRGMNASQISLASISSPLQHTLVKTDFNYPKNGPTQEQMKFLGSRESLALFGVPFGSAAVAYSKVEPPPFDVPASGSGESGQLSGESSQPQDNGQSSGHTLEATDDTVVPSPAHSSSEAPIPEEVSSAKEDQDGKEISLRNDSRDPASPTTSRPGTSSSAGFATAHSISRPTSADGEAKMSIPMTIVREPSPGPPTPPPTPPRQSLNVSEDEGKLMASDTRIVAGASA